MFNIASFLEKFAKNLNSSELYKKQILEILIMKTGISLEPEDLEIKNHTIVVKASPGVKNKIFIHKAQILEEIERTISLKIVDVR